MATSDGRERWLVAGQQLLRSDGIPAVKLEAMCRATGLTTGSFYHHFPNMAAFLDALARHYGADQTESLLAEIDEDDPLERLRHLQRIAAGEQMRPLDAAMRDWAGSDPVAAGSVRAADAALLRFIEAALVDLGHPRDEARLRAYVVLAVGVTRIQTPWPLPDDAVDRALELLTGGR